MDLPAGLFLKEVSPDVVAFELPFEIEGKAIADEASVDILEDGDLIIEGYAALFDGEDRTKENFTEGAFEKGMKSFLDGSAALCYHHKREKCLGKVLLLEETDKGLKMRARVDGAIKDHPELGPIYKQIKKGSLGALSVGGFFRRKLTPMGKRISDMDFTEISVTPVPVHAKTSFEVIAGKALDDWHPEGETPAVETESEQLDLSELQAPLEQLTALFAQLGGTPEGKAVKGDPQDLHFLALVIELEKFSNNLYSSEDADEGSPEDEKVDELVKEVKDGMDQWARQAHKLASRLGPLPTIQYV